MTASDLGLDPQTPVLVGVAVCNQQAEDPAAGQEAFQLMAKALQAAAADAGNPLLLADADSIMVPQGTWQYSDAARLVADAVGATKAKTVLAQIGILQQTLLNDACRAIAAGEQDIVLVIGGETKYRNLRSSILGQPVQETLQKGVLPDQVLTPEEELWSTAEAASGLAMPVGYYTIMENALRYSQDQNIDDHRDEIAELCASMSAVAQNNPQAWNRDPIAASAIRNEEGKNKMLAFPYTKLHNSQWNVDQTAGLIFCSVAVAEKMGVPREKWIFPLAGTESNHMVTLSARKELHRNPGMAIAGKRALELAGIDIDAIKYLELYSCFPVAVRIQQNELGVAPNKPVTVTGGMTFAGGPLNNFVFQALVRMAEVLRADPGTTGLVSCVSGMITKQGFGLYSTEPINGGFQFQDVSAEVAANTTTCSILEGYQGSATIAGYTVLYNPGAPTRGVIVADTPTGERVIAYTEDPELTALMVAEEFCGETVVICGDNTFC